MAKKSIKDKVKEKAKALKEKLKGAKKCAALVAALVAAVLCGCMDTNPASRSNDNRVGDIEPAVKIVFDEGASSNSVIVTMPITLGDGLIASADSAGSTETQTATPTLDIRTKIDARYNDAMAAASTTSKSVLDTLTDWWKESVLGMMASKATGKVEVEKKDGTKATVECKDGQCSIVSACPEGKCANGVCSDCAGGTCSD